MASRWLSLVLGLALLQGSLSFSPIDLSDEEWNAYRNMMNDVTYRLTPNVRPSHYTLNLRPYLSDSAGTNRFTFTGDVEITVRTTTPTNTIVLHSNDLAISSATVRLASTNENVPVSGSTLDPARSFFTIDLGQTNLVINTDYIIRIEFRGNLQTNMRGFYRSWYNDVDANNLPIKRWMATTQFQPHHARQAFPCFDEPSFKATFDISIERDEDYSVTLSNMELLSSSPVVNGRVTDTFRRTPVTSTYLLAIIVSHYRQVEAGTNPQRPFQIYARSNAGTTGAWSLAVGEPLLEVMDRYTEIPYYQMGGTEAGVRNMNMKQAAIPDFSAGAMENWGLLTYREALILYDPQNSNHFYRQRVANIISHEIAHMWFGNLVTCDWWDNLWLNEGFARFYQYYLTDVVAPDMGYDTRFIVEQVHVSLLSDAAANAHPLTDLSVSAPGSVSNHFSQITYGKGAAVLRMTQHLLGNDTYVTALRTYLRDRSYQTALPEHLFSALQTAANANGALPSHYGITIESYFKSWSERAGHPLLTINIDHATGRITVFQTRFDRDSGTSETVDGVWQVPITWTREGAPDFNNLKPSVIMRTPVLTIDRGSTGREWVIFNLQQTGFYRVNYDQITWVLITQALRGSNRLAIHEYNRAQIVDDVFLLARSHILSYNRAFNILSFLEFEDQYAPWIAAIAGYNFALRRLAHDAAAVQSLKNDIIFKSATRVVSRLGYVEQPNGNYMDDLLRMYLLTFLCDAGYEPCVNQARTNFQAWRTAGTRIPPNLRPWVYCTGLRVGNAADFTYFWNQYLAEELASEQVVMITAAGCTSDETSLTSFLNAIITGPRADNPLDVTAVVIRPQDRNAAINSAVNSNDYNPMRVFTWVQANVARIKEVLGDDGVGTFLTPVTNRLLNDEDISQVSEWIESNRALIGESSYNSARAGIRNSEAIFSWYDERKSEFNEYFENGYIGEDFTNPPATDPPATDPPTTDPPATDPPATDPPTTDPPTTDPPTTEDPTTEALTTPEITTPDPGSANIASLSIVTLIVTVIINIA